MAEGEGELSEDQPLQKSLRRLDCDFQWIGNVAVERSGASRVFIQPLGAGLKLVDLYGLSAGKHV